MTPINAKCCNGCKYHYYIQEENIGVTFEGCKKYGEIPVKVTYGFNCDNVSLWQHFKNFIIGKLI